MLVTVRAQRYARRMSAPDPLVPIKLRRRSPKRLAAIRELLDRVERGDESGTVPWKRSPPGSAWRVLLDEQVLSRLRRAGPRLQGYVDGIVVFLGVDPTATSLAFPVVAGDGFRRIVFADGQGCLDYRVFEERKVVVVVDLAFVE